LACAGALTFGGDEDKPWWGMSGDPSGRRKGRDLLLTSPFDIAVRSTYHSRDWNKMAFHITPREVGSVAILDISGPIVLGDEIETLREAIHKLIAEDKKKIILNLAGVNYIDSSGVGELVGSFTTVRNAGGELKLLHLNPKVRDVLHVTKLYTVFDIKDEEFTAVKSFDYFFAK
jgi:anti-sigma B factor antagonist